MSSARSVAVRPRRSTSCRTRRTSRSGRSSTSGKTGRRTSGSLDQAIAEYEVPERSTPSTFAASTGSSRATEADLHQGTVPGHGVRGRRVRRTASADDLRTGAGHLPADREGPVGHPQRRVRPRRHEAEQRRDLRRRHGEDHRPRSGLSDRNSQGAHPGTPDYIAPEQVHRRQITPKTDIYNFGATMYWVLTQQHIPTAMSNRAIRWCRASTIR